MCYILNRKQRLNQVQTPLHFRDFGGNRCILLAIQIWERAFRFLHDNPLRNRHRQGKVGVDESRNCQLLFFVWAVSTL